MINSKELLEYTKNLTILFAEDHNELRENTSEILKNFFKEVDSAKNGEEAFFKYKKYHHENSKYYDIVISDIQMPKINGVELTKKIYTINSTQTIIILSAFDNSHYLLPLINLGIEHFIKKPLDYQEFLKVLLNTSRKIIKLQNLNENEKNEKINLNENFIFNKNTKTLTNKNENIYLTNYEIIFMELITTNVGKVYSNKEIVDGYQDNDKEIDTQNIRKLVSKLRKKLPTDTIESVYGIGYKIIPYFGI